VSRWVRLPTDPCYRQEYLRPLHLLLRLLCNSPISSSAWLCPSVLLLSLALSLSLSLSLTRSHVRSLGCDAASCSCRCWPCAALARLCLARTFSVPPSPSRISFAPISLSSRQALVAPRHQASRLLIASRPAPHPPLLYVPHFRHQSINQSSWRGFRCKSLTDECIVVVSGRFVVVIIEWLCDVRSNTR